MGKGKTHIFLGFWIQRDIYISSWKRTQLLSTKASVCAIHDRPGKVTWGCNSQSSCPMSELGSKIRAKALVHGPVLLPYPCPLRAESRGKTTWRLGIQKERGHMSCYPSGALLASQMYVGRPQEGWVLANPDNPSDSSEVSFLVQRQRGGLRVLAREMAMERCPRLFIYAAVWVWVTKDENPLGIYAFHIFLGSRILQVHPFIGVIVCLLLFRFFTCSHRF